MLGKKGMSPLIVTIILIAFAVALGAMIMNWSSDVVAMHEPSCATSGLEIQKAFGRDMICFDDVANKLKVTIKNSGSTDISSIMFRRILSNFQSQDNVLPNSALKTGEIYDASIGFVMEDKVHVEFIPKIKKGQNTLVCQDNALIFEKIEPCPK